MWRMFMISLRDQVTVSTPDGVLSGVIVGRTISSPTFYDVKTEKGVVFNADEKRVNPCS